MKNAVYIFLGFMAFFFTLYFADKYNKQHTHATLNASAELPDEYLIDMVVAHQRENKKECLYKLEKVIESFWTLEKDVDNEGALLMEEGVTQLETLHKRLTIDSVSDSEMRDVYQESLRTLAQMELHVAVNQMQAGDIYQAKVALRYVTIHIKNSMLFLNRELDYKQIGELKKANKLVEQLIVNEDLTTKNFQTASIISHLNNTNN